MPLVLFLLAIFAVALPAAADDQLLERGFQSLDARAFPDAIRDFQQALAENPDDAKAHEGLAWAYYETRDFAQAAREADRRLALSPDDKDWRRSWAIIVWETPDRQAEVLTTVRRWAEADPADRPAQRLYAKVAADSGNYDQGRSVLNGLLASDPSDVEALATLAQIERWDQRYELARDLLARAFALNPTDEALRQDLFEVTREAQGHRIAHFEPTLPITLIVIVFSVLIGTAVTKLTPAVHLMTLFGLAVLVAAALAWLYAVPLG
jgi:tetratricopeptide (TPR) repeat protein